jgi:ABC-type lipoprotein release transport system permease subunit
MGFALIGTTLAESFRLWRARPVRSALSLAGIYIGALTLMVILGLRRGAAQQIQRLASTHGTQVFLLSPQNLGNPGFRHLLNWDTRDALAKDPHIETVLPRLTQQKWVRTPRETLSAHIMGIDPRFPQTYLIPFAEGRTFLPIEMTRKHPVCLLTRGGQKKLFPYGVKIGDSVDLQEIPTTVIGILEWDHYATQRSFSGKEPDILIPFTRFYEERRAVPLTLLEIRADLRFRDDQVAEAIRRIVGRGDPKMDAYYSIQPYESFVQSAMAPVSEMFRTLMAIALISLLIGTIGIANVMLVSVTERIPEIGIRQALGATHREILLQFLTESCALTSAAGLAATGSVIAAKMLLPLVDQHPMPFTLSALELFTGLFVTCLVGLIAGIYPANHGASLSPAEALQKI